MLIYIHPKANVDTATRIVAKTVQRLQRMTPDAPKFVMGDLIIVKWGSP